MREKAKPFIDWLEQASEEEEDDDDEEEGEVGLTFSVDIFYACAMDLRSIRA